MDEVAGSWTLAYTLGSFKTLAHGHYTAEVGINRRLNADSRSSLTNEKDHHYFLNRFVCAGQFFDG